MVQVGAYVWVDADCFVKAGLEYTDGVPRLSVVVTNNGWSDWSTQAWPLWDGHTMRVRVRVHKLQRPEGACIVVEADTSPSPSPSAGAPGACALARPARWTFVRIAPLHVPVGTSAWRMGVYAACPVRAGAEATFSHVTVGPLQPPVHADDASAMV
jgi:uncharacterized protein